MSTAGIPSEPIPPAVIEQARRLWDYAASFRSRGPADLIVLCGSYDLRVCDHACDLLRQGLADRLLISGDRGNWTRELWQEPEALVFARRAVANGVDPAAILIEPKATNFGENIALARELAPEAKTAIFVTKPNSALRVALTVPVRWPEIAAHVDGPSFEFPAQVSEVIGLRGVIEELVGDIHRVIEYPKLGYKVEHALPTEILAAWRWLIDAGFTGHLIPGPMPGANSR